MNRGAYFGVEVAVGTPEQKFELVADTGSNNLLVASCTCGDAGGCPGAEHCYRGTNRSSTFVIEENASHNPIEVTYGSGTIAAVIATDLARVGPLSATMHESLLLMVSDQELNINGPFEGILGLGVPGPGMEDDEPLPEGVQAIPSKSFLDEAKVTSFSMCFSEGAEGSMEMGAPVPNPLQAVGKYHWGVGLAGISVTGGSASNATPVPVCQASDPDAGTETPCGLIPDSGTTLMMGPAAHVAALYAGICDQWARCTKLFGEAMEHAKKPPTAADDEFGPVLDELASPKPAGGDAQHHFSHDELIQAKAMTMMAALEACEDWLEEGSSEFMDMPSVRMKLTDLTGAEQNIELTPWAYVMVSDAELSLVSMPREKVADRVPMFQQSLETVIPGDVEQRAKVCQPAFDVMEYQTKNNGAVWILGSPLFFQYKVGYDLTGPSMSFSKLETEESCHACRSEPESMMLRGQAVKPHHRQPRGLRAPPRRPRIDTRVPF